MKTTKFLGLTALIAVITLGFAAVSLTSCEDPTSLAKPKDFSGIVSITPGPTVTVGQELTAMYSGSEGVGYQWNKNGTAINGATSARFTPNEPGSYTVTISAAGYKSMTSTPVTVTAASGNLVKTLDRIEAVYTPDPENAIFPDTTLDTLKDGLTVTAYYSDDTSAPLAADDYGLSGELTAGESAVTVTYTEDGVTKTAAFTVTVGTPHEHNWSKAEGGTPPTCTAPGTERWECNAISPSHYELRTVDALGHDAGEWHTTLEPACETTGTKQLRCTRDNAVLTDSEPIAALGHDWKDSYQQTTPPTCEEAAIETDTCKRNAEHTRTRDGAAALGHDYAAAFSQVLAPAETVNGREAKVCSRNPAHENEPRPLWATGTAGLEYTLIPDGEENEGAYSVSKGTVTAGAVHIAAYWRGDSTDYDDYKPITKIPSTAFGELANGSGIPRITTVHIPATVTTIGQNAFAYCRQITAVTFAENSQLKTISQSAFNDCRALTSINIPAAVTEIGNRAFYYCSALTGITISAGVTVIGSEAFGECRALTSITVAEGNTVYASQDGIVYNAAKTSILIVPIGISGSVTIPNGVTSIGDSAFANCSSLTGVTIPAGVTSIGETAFYLCSALVSINIPEGVTSIGDSAFVGCRRLTSITLPASLTSIGGYVFNGCTDLASITFLATTPPTLGLLGGNMAGYDTFAGTPTTLQIKVPADSVAAYKAATPLWIDHADKIVAIE